MITRIADQPAGSVTLAWLLVGAEVGDELTVEFFRDGTSRSATIVLAEQQ